MNQHTAIFTGRILGNRYKLLSQIAAGGMGEVWRARDQITGKTVAAKVLLPELSGEEISLSRLRLEAQNTMTARHPNIAAVLDSGEDDGQGWIIMELVLGRPLTDYIGGGKTLTPEELIPVLVQTAYALDAAARVDIVHRDIKPANIMISKDGLVKLTDFGISFAKGQANLTAAGMVMGTAQYLAPEQALGEEAKPTGDLYSLGIIAFEALQGRRPFTGKTQVDIAMAHVQQPVPNLPEHVPADLASIVYNLLSKEPQDRPPSGAELVRSLIEVARDLNITNPTWIPDSFYEKAGQNTDGKSTKRTANAVSTSGENRSDSSKSSTNRSANGASRAIARRPQAASAASTSAATISSSGVRAAKSGGAAQLTSANPQSLVPADSGSQEVLSDSRPELTRSRADLVRPQSAAATPPATSGYRHPTAPASASRDRSRPLPPQSRQTPAADQTMFLDGADSMTYPAARTANSNGNADRTNITGRDRAELPPTFAPNPIRTTGHMKAVSIRHNPGQAVTYAGRQSPRELQPVRRNTAVSTRSGQNLARDHTLDGDDSSSSRWGLFLIVALVILTVVLIVVAILTGDSEEEVSDAASFMQVAWSWEVNTW